VEVRGIEPLSENTPTPFSTSVAYLLRFPRPSAEWQALGVGSFIVRVHRKA